MNNSEFPCTFWDTFLTCTELYNMKWYLKMKLFYFYVTKNDDKRFFKSWIWFKISCMYFRVFKKVRVCTCIHDTRYTIHNIDEFRVYMVTSLFRTSIVLYVRHTYCNIKNLRLSRFELAYIHCESGALSTEPLPRGTLPSCCAQYICRPDSAL